MALTSKNIIHNQLAIAKTTLYTVASGRTYVHSFTIFNANAIQQTVQIYMRADGATELQEFEIVIPSKDTVLISLPNEGWVLENGGYIAAACSAATSITLTVSGTEDP